MTVNFGWWHFKELRNIVADISNHTDKPDENDDIKGRAYEDDVDEVR